MTFEKYLTYQFWFGQPIPPAIHKFDIAVLILSVAIGLAGFAIAVWRPHLKDKFKRKLFKRFYRLLLTIGILGILWYGLRFELIQVWGTRIVAALIYIAALVWAWRIWVYYKNTYLVEIDEHNRQEVKNKYL